MRPGAPLLFLATVLSTGVLSAPTIEPAQLRWCNEKDQRFDLTGKCIDEKMGFDTCYLIPDSNAKGDRG
ncbi:hypothetical protein OHC33_005520, partial [Knufia fluminis]